MTEPTTIRLTLAVKSALADRAAKEGGTISSVAHRVLAQAARRWNTKTAPAVNARAVVHPKELASHGSLNDSTDGQRRG